MEMADAADIALNPGQLHAFYTGRFPYYATLDAQYKELLINRCLTFLSEKEIVPGGGFVLTNAIKALVSASAVQLTLGLDTWDINYFETIVIYPAEFESMGGGLLFKGETNTAGFIRLSWKSFTHGYSKTSDNINLGLHEFSHALRFNNIKGHGQDYFFEHYFNAWLAVAYEAYYDIKNNRSTIFRKYGGANINEFISVCIEHYFESPEEIRQRYPQLYYATGILLNQNTSGQKTEIGIRHQWLQQKSEALPGFTSQQYVMKVYNTKAFPLLVAFGGQWLFAACVAGPVSGISFFYALFALPALYYVHTRSVRLQLHGKTMSVKRGIFGSAPKELPLACLISFKRIAADRRREVWKFVYYNMGNRSFYEETVLGRAANSEQLMRELSRNKIARPVGE